MYLQPFLHPRGVKKNDYWLWPVVIEKDKDIVKVIKKGDDRIRVYERDIRDVDLLPEVEVQTFITDPPYNLQGALSFICAGLKILTKKDEEKEFYVIINEAMMGRSLFYLQNILSSAGIYLSSVVENFSQYDLPPNYDEKKRADRFARKMKIYPNFIYLSSSSNLYIFKTKRFNIKKFKNL